jgi:hypothetical protein
MSARNQIRESWRNRFLEIARRYEATGDAGLPPIAMPGLRRRKRMSGFATLSRSRPSLPR